MDVWLFKNAELPINVNNYLSIAEKKKANQFYNERDKKQFLYQHAWMNKILSLYLPKFKPQELQFILNPFGKPFLKEIEFNLSHASDWTILAVTCNNPVGVDIEKMTRLDCLGIASALFSQAEYHQIKKLKEIKQLYAFFQIWSQKEAFIKAIGKGLSYDTSSFTVNWNSNKNNVIVDYETNNGWLITRFFVEIGYASAICYYENVNKINFFKLI